VSEIAPRNPKVVAFHNSPEARADEATASLIEVLQEHLTLAREGKLRSVAVVSVSADGSAIGTQWFCANGDIATLIGKLTVLIHDVMAARQ
jgi:chromosome condensin MukBEF MukE localization factor